MADRVVLITASAAQRVLNDAAALAASPSLSRMREAAVRAVAGAREGRRCSSCASRAVSASVTAAFARWAADAAPDELAAAKRAAGADAFLVQAVDPKTGARAVKRI